MLQSHQALFFQPPPETNLGSNYDGEPVEFFNNSSYSCVHDDVFFESDRDQEFWNLTCLDDGSWETPVWPRCLESVNCTEPPDRPGTGTWEWSGDYEYLTQILYTCGPYGQFISARASLYSQVIAECQWNKTWSPEVLDPCQGRYFNSSTNEPFFLYLVTACQTMPLADDETGLVLTQGPQSSKSQLFSPRLPAKLTVPEEGLCGTSSKIMVVGKIGEKARKSLNIIVHGVNYTEAIHVEISVKKEYVKRWAVVEGSLDKVSEDVFGTSIDADEPFVINLSCDEDGWRLQINEEEAYQHFFHMMPTDQFQFISIKGDAEMSFAGVVPQDLLPSSFFPVGYNVTYECPDGMVFEHDWFASPFVLITCKVSFCFQD